MTSKWLRKTVMIFALVIQWIIEPAFAIQPRNPADLVLDLYKKNQLILLANADHDNNTTYWYLAELLKEVGNDPNLGAIVLERFSDNDDFYQNLSQFPLEDQRVSKNFSNPGDKRLSLCSTGEDSGEWAFAIATLFPLLREINATRPDNPILVRTIDGITVDRMKNDIAAVPRSNVEISSEDCTLKNPYPVYTSSANRESDTAGMFKKRVLPFLQANKKVILMYHYWHVVKGFKSCQMINTERRMKTNVVPLNWAEHASTSLTKDYRTATIVFDGKSRTNPNGIFSFSEQFSRQYPDRDFGYLVKGMTFSGKDIFHSNSFIRTYLDGKIIGSVNIDKSIDAVVWSHDQERRFSIKPPADYLPSYCSKQ